ncbi:MAG: redoxin domain-containing protein [Bacilli bacterium]|nr:redoxin domain-containing protein [Bacilli bacterium]
MNIYDISVKKRGGDEVSLADFKGKVLLALNTATGCGFTPQYEAIENLYEKYHDKGFEVLDFPCDQFGHQAPGSDDEIHGFCTAKYNTKFEQFAKIEVNGENEEKLFTYLKNSISKDEINGVKNKMTMAGVKKISKTCINDNDIVWIFTKFLVDKEGNVVRRLSPIEDPMLLEDDINKLL